MEGTYLAGAVANAAERGDLQAVKAWLARPSSYIDATDGSWWTLLHHACLPIDLSADNLALAEYLLSRGASVNHGDDGSVLHCAVARHCRSHPTDMVGLLLRAGADVDARDDRGESPIAWAISDFREVGANLTERELTRALECVVQLLRYGASLADGSFGFEGEKPRSLEDFMEFQASFSPGITSNQHWIDCQAIVTGVKTAGSWRAFRDDKTNPWRAYERVPRKAVLRLRSLVARKRAKTTNPLINALFGLLCWPVLFVYEEHRQRDFVQTMPSNACLADQLCQMFPPSD